MLDQWDGMKNGRSAEQRVRHLRQLALALINCIQRQTQKRRRKQTEHDNAFIKAGKGPSNRLITRIAGSESLLKQVMIRLAYEQVQYQKVTRSGVGAHLRGAGKQALRPGYDHERQAFLGMKAQGNLGGVSSFDTATGTTNNAGLVEPVGSSYLRDCHKAVQEGHITLQGGHVLFDQNFTNVGFAQLTPNQLDAFAQFLGGQDMTNVGISELPQVHSARKDERINKNMLVPLKRKLYAPDGHVDSTRRGSIGKLPQNANNDGRGFFLADTYAMGRYVNLFHQLNPTGHPFSPVSQWNHSSLVAGGDVICAGLMISRTAT